MKEPVTLNQRKKNMPVSCGKMISEADIQRLEKNIPPQIPDQDDCGNLYRLSDTFTAFFEMISGQTLAHGMHVNRDL
ncbi:hypothetical protein [Cronobacter turicensis]|uniref:hypothetical protein n=1 Tax=Cronobacter turicensis TaxID=413502 RepID=UPI0020CA6690|nr:hypothetical protein [Cronobacter turicensis]